MTDSLIMKSAFVLSLVTIATSAAYITSGLPVLMWIVVLSAGAVAGLTVRGFLSDRKNQG